MYVSNGTTEDGMIGKTKLCDIVWMLLEYVRKMQDSFMKIVRKSWENFKNVIRTSLGSNKLQI